MTNGNELTAELLSSPDDTPVIRPGDTVLLYVEWSDDGDDEIVLGSIRERAEHALPGVKVRLINAPIVGILRPDDADQ